MVKRDATASAAAYEFDLLGPTDQAVAGRNAGAGGYSCLCRIVHALVACCLLSTWLPAPAARAEAPVAGSALPGVREAPLLHPFNPLALRAQGTLHYGFTEPLSERAGSHHRLGLDLAASLALTSHYAFALELQARHDRHKATSETSADQGSYLRSRIRVRGHWPLGPNLLAGAEGTIMLPAASRVGDALSGVGFAGDAMLGLTLPSLLVGARIGLRWDRGHRSLADVETLSVADRIALDVSQFRELRFGIAASTEAYGLTWGAEWTWDLAVGRGSPSAWASPMWLRGGPWVHLGPLDLGVLLGISPSRRPSFSDDAPLVRVEPRVWAGIQLVSAWSLRPPQDTSAVGKAPKQQTGGQLHVSVSGFADAPVEGAHVAHGAHGCDTDRKGSCDIPTPDRPTQIAVSASDYITSNIAYAPLAQPPPGNPTLQVALQPAALTLRGLVKLKRGGPLSDAAISVMRGDQQIDARTDSTGRFEVADLDPGEFVIRVEAPQVSTAEHTIALKPGQTSFTFAESPPTQRGQLRGRIRALDGRPLIAHITIQPGALKLKSDAQGEFALELNEGDYTIDIAAAGFSSQNRQVKVERHGVVVMLVDLRVED